MSFLELTLKLKGFPLDKAEKELSAIKALSRAGFAEWQLKKRLDITGYHFNNNEFYRHRLGGKLPDNWNDLPVLQKSDYQQDKLSVISKTIEPKDLYTGYTSGSSGHPFRYAKDKFAHAMTWALIKDRYKYYGLTLDSKQARFYGIPFEKFDYYVERTKDFLANRLRFPVFDLSDEVLHGFLDKFRSVRFDYVYGYTNSIVLFARYLIKEKVLLREVCPTLKVCICTSENCTAEDQEIIEKAFGVKAVNEYGTSEVDLIAFEDLEGVWRLSHENIFIEVLDESDNPIREKGEGRIVLTSLYNRAMPFIRYEIGDRAYVEIENGDINIKRLLGGVNDIVVLPSGKISSGISFYFITRKILENSGGLKEFIIKQVAANKFVFEVVSDEDIPERDKQLIQKNIDLYLEPGLSFEIERVDKIQRTKAGKMKHFYSYIN
jgi:phenylacetate-CoA ligase